MNFIKRAREEIIRDSATHSFSFLLSGARARAGAGTYVAGQANEVWGWRGDYAHTHAHLPVSCLKSVSSLTAVDEML